MLNKLAKLINNHPLFILAALLITVIVFTVSTTKYFLDDMKIENYKSKIDVLENEIIILREENEKYLNWLESIPKSIPFLEKRILKLEEEVRNYRRKYGLLKSQTIFDTTSSITQIRLGETITIPTYGITIGIKNIYENRSIDISILNPYGTTTLEKLELGDGRLVYSYKLKKNLRLLVRKINWLNNSAAVQIYELK